MPKMSEIERAYREGFEAGDCASSNMVADDCWNMVADEYWENSETKKTLNTPETTEPQTPADAEQSLEVCPGPVSDKPGNVVGFRLAEASPEPDQDLVNGLRTLLHLAKTGKLTGMIACTVFADGHMSNEYMGTIRYQEHALLNALSALRLMQDLDDANTRRPRFSSVEVPDDDDEPTHTQS